MLPIPDQIDMELRKLASPGEYNEWLNRPNVELNFRMPGELLRRREYQELWKLIYVSTRAVNV